MSKSAPVASYWNPEVTWNRASDEYRRWIFMWKSLSSTYEGGIYLPACHKSLGSMLLLQNLAIMSFSNESLSIDAA